MKSKRFILVLIIFVLLTAGWYLSVKTASGVDMIKKQQELAMEADKLAAKKLYVRAIPKYEEALKYSTAKNSEMTLDIEAKLLDSYWKFEQYGAYADLVEKRVSKGTASEEEYIKAAQYYIDSASLEEAMSLLAKGMEKSGSKKLEDMYEANRYTYSICMTDYADITPTAENSIMPAFDGEKWGYANDRGRMVIEFKYDLAIPFNSAGLAVVVYQGKYYVITSNDEMYGVDETGITDVYDLTDNYILAQSKGKYSYYNYDFECVAEGHQYEQITSNSCGLAAVKKDGKWGIISDSGSVVVDFTLEDVAVNSLGRVYMDNKAMVKENGKWYLIDNEGNKISETGFVNAKAPESDGYIAVADSKGLWGFINGEGELVIDYQYTDAKSFSQHLAAVRKGADWGYISEKNKLVIEQFIEEAQPFHNGRAQVKLVEGEGLIELEYTK